MKKIFRTISTFVLAVLLLLGMTSSPTYAQGKSLTSEELSEYNGKDGAKSYTSYKGIVYDVSDSKLWKLGEHFGLEAGKDLTEDMAEAPHGDEVFQGFVVIGTLSDFTDEEPVMVKEATAEDTTLVAEAQASSADTTPWYAKRIRFAGFSILGWTGIVLGIFFILTFATCFALPWAKLPLPWTGTKIGPDPLDDSGTHMKWSSVHKYFVWVTVVFGIIHGIIGFLQMFGLYL